MQKGKQEYIADYYFKKILSLKHQYQTKEKKTALTKIFDYGSYGEKINKIKNFNDV